MGGLCLTHDEGNGDVAVTSEFDRDEDAAAEMLLSWEVDDMPDDVVDI